MNVDNTRTLDDRTLRELRGGRVAQVILETTRPREAEFASLLTLNQNGSLPEISNGL